MKLIYSLDTNTCKYTNTVDQYDSVQGGTCQKIISRKVTQLFVYLLMEMYCVNWKIEEINKLAFLSK